MTGTCNRRVEMEMGLNLDVILAVLAVIALTAFLVQRVRNGGKRLDAKDLVVSLDDVARIHNAVRDSTKEDVFAVFLIPYDQASKNDGVPTVEFSQENGTIGLDYVLLSKENLAKQEAFVRLAVSLGHEVVSHTLADVPYLRVNGEGLPNLMRDTLLHVFGVGPDEEMGIVLEGVDHNQLFPVNQRS